MGEWHEGDLRLIFEEGLKVTKFDGEEHGLSHCMKAVDFVVELDDRVLYIELKDPEHPRATEKERKNFQKSLSEQTESLMRALTTKARDTFLYQFGLDRVDKPVYYVVLIGVESLDSAALSHLTDSLKHQIPVLGPEKRPWKRPFIQSAAVFSLKTVNQQNQFGLRVERISQQGEAH